MTHYNPPYADLYMEVLPDARRRGFGSLVLQAAKADCYAQELVPAARTGVTNVASQATLRRRPAPELTAGCGPESRPAT